MRTTPFWSILSCGMRQGQEKFLSAYISFDFPVFRRGNTVFAAEGVPEIVAVLKAAFKGYLGYALFCF